MSVRNNGFGVLLVFALFGLLVFSYFTGYSDGKKAADDYYAPIIAGLKTKAGNCPALPDVAVGGQLYAEICSQQDCRNSSTERVWKMCCERTR